MSPLLIGFAPDPSSLLAGLRRAERGVRRLELPESEFDDGRAAALSTVSSDREDDEDEELDRLVRLELGRDEDPDSLREEGLDELRLEESLPEVDLDERRPEERFSSPVGCSRRFSFELEPELDFEELREERFGGATRAVSQ